MSMLLRPAFALLLLSMLVPVSLSGQDSAERVIVPGQRVGGITGETSESELLELFGEQNVRSADIDLGEGMTVPGTVVFPDRPELRLEIRWRDPATRNAPEAIVMTGSASRWKTAKGLGLGTTLREIQELNGKPFRLTGFEWDYAGTILDCNLGKLRELGWYDPDEPRGALHPGGLALRLLPEPAGVELASPEEYESVAGDRVFLSSHPVMQKLNPKVYQLVVSF